MIAQSHLGECICWETGWEEEGEAVGAEREGMTWRNEDGSISVGGRSSSKEGLM